jgi:hypothetical protein
MLDDDGSSHYHQDKSYHRNYPCIVAGSIENTGMAAVVEGVLR